MEMIEKGLTLEELEVHTAELLPDRLEMRRHSRIRKSRKRGFECSPTNVQVADDENEVEQDIQCFRIST